MLVATGTSERPGRPIVLVVSNDRRLVEALCYSLQQTGFAPSCACEEPDLVLIDTATSALPASRGVPVMALVEAHEAAIRAAIAGGADDFLTQPFSVSATVS
jgi:DNA-binding response OmpR family regulator